MIVVCVVFGSGHRKVVWQDDVWQSRKLGRVITVINVVFSTENMNVWLLFIIKIVHVVRSKNKNSNKRVIRTVETWEKGTSHD